MTQVSITINGRQFRMACEDSQESHLINLARELDARISAFRNEFGELSDTRLIVMAAITVIDELAGAGLRIKRLEEEIAALQNARVATSDGDMAAQAAIASTVNAAAERVESITKRLNQTIDPDPRSGLFEDPIAGDLEKEITQKEDAGAPENEFRQSEFF
jgi:cell division protein ZapA